MKLEMILRRVAGSVILGTLLLARFQNSNWLWFTAFVGFNLLQSSFTGFCPVEFLLRRMGVGSAGASGAK